MTIMQEGQHISSFIYFQRRNRGLGSTIQINLELQKLRAGWISSHGRWSGRSPRPLPQTWQGNCLRLRDLRSQLPKHGVKCLAFPPDKKLDSRSWSSWPRHVERQFGRATIKESKNQSYQTALNVGKRKVGYLSKWCVRVGWEIKHHKGTTRQCVG